MCNTAHMCDYGGVGGKWQRGNPTCGRVGSILSDAGTNVSASAVSHTENFGDSWGLVEGEQAPATDGELFFAPEPGSIMIGP